MKNFVPKPDWDPQEAQFQAQVIHTARKLGWLVHHCRAAPRRSGGFSTPIQGCAGFPDLVLVNTKTGYVIFAELKKNGGSLSESQIEWLNHLHNAVDDWGRALVVVWRPREWDDIVEVLKSPLEE